VISQERITGKGRARNGFALFCAHFYYALLGWEESGYIIKTKHIEMKQEKNQGYEFYFGILQKEISG
jgi:hypothetical protein